MPARNQKKIAVVAFQLGGPTSPEAVEPFLFNLFSDPYILEIPQPFRWFLAKRISRKRHREAEQIYAQMGGKSPLLENSQAQCNALENRLNRGNTDFIYKCFLAMRYWHPMTPDCVNNVRDFDPDEVVFVPFYPQYSRSTSGSSLRVWMNDARKQGLSKNFRFLCCYPENRGFIEALARSATKAIDRCVDETGGWPRVLFSAHSLPISMVKKGDPYPLQIEASANSCWRSIDRPKAEMRICYQSKVGKVPWLEPSTEEEIEKAGRDRMALVVVPIAFVSEHSETLVELDRDYKELAKKVGCPYYLRVPTVGISKEFVEGLSTMIERAVMVPMEDSKLTVPPESGLLSSICLKNNKRCARFPGSIEGW